jgi:tetratricopeptide (TPR) repeat protein
MPQTPTEIQHLAFTHHRIGIHPPPTGAGETATQRPSEVGVLEPFHDLSRFRDFDRQRSLGIAYAELATGEKAPDLAMAYDRRAGELLRPLAERGLQDPTLEFVLYMSSARSGLGEPIQHAEKALSLPRLPIRFRCEALFAVARARASQGRYEEALGLLGQLTQLRRKHRDWVLMAACEEGRKNQPAAVKASEMAVRINTRLPELHRNLAEYYRWHGDHDRAAWHRQRAVGP